MYTDPNALTMQPKIDIEQMTGVATAMIKISMAGRGEEVWDTAKRKRKHLWGVVA